MNDEDEQLCMSYALGTLDETDREVFEARLKASAELQAKVTEFETLYAEQELGEESPVNTRLKEAIMTQISADQSNNSEETQPMLASQAIWLLVFGLVIVVVCFLAFGVSLAK